MHCHQSVAINKSARLAQAGPYLQPKLQINPDLPQALEYKAREQTNPNRSLQGDLHLSLLLQQIRRVQIGGLSKNTNCTNSPNTAALYQYIATIITLFAQGLLWQLCTASRLQNASSALLPPGQVS